MGQGVRVATIGGAGGREQRSEGRREKPDRDVTDEHERVRGEAVVEVEVEGGVIIVINAFRESTTAIASGLRV